MRQAVLGPKCAAKLAVAGKSNLASNLIDRHVHVVEEQMSDIKRPFITGWVPPATATRLPRRLAL